MQQVEIYEQQRSELESSLQPTQARASELEAEVKSMQETLAGVRGELQSMQARVEAAERRESDAMEKHRALESSMREQLHQAQNQAKQSGELVATQRGDLERLQRERDSLLQRLSLAESRVSQLQDDIFSKSSQVALCFYFFFFFFFFFFF